MTDRQRTPTRHFTNLLIEISPSEEEPDRLRLSLQTSDNQAPIRFKEGDIHLSGGQSPQDDYRSMQLTIGIGRAAKLNAERLRRAGGRLGSWLLNHDVDQASVSVEEIRALGVDGGISAFCEGLQLGSFHFDRYQSQTGDRVSTRVHLIVEDPDPDLLGQVKKTTAVAHGVNLARSWAHEPPNIINPDTLADRAQSLAREFGLNSTVLAPSELEALGAGAILAVGQGSRTPSRLIVLEYQGSEERGQPVVIVGKAITFDTGGYSLKKKTKIVGMKYDKCGGMTVIGLMRAVAEIQPPFPVIGIVAAAENMISENAYRPNDIITTLSGKTVEIISADAEGRLVLADALTYAQRQYHPRALIDVATLTGGIVTALGDVRAGLFATDDDLAESLITSGERTHERLWRMPLDSDYFQLVRGDDSDLKNSGGRKAHPIIGGIFLRQFIQSDVPWAHLDIAGVSKTETDQAYCPRGATGFGVRLLIDYLSHL
jgi:leucyl aminopeptidase